MKTVTYTSDVTREKKGRKYTKPAEIGPAVFAKR